MFKMIIQVSRIIFVVSIFFILPIICVENDIREGCNEIVCSSIVTKCLLINDCRCDMKNETCNANCSRCLKTLWRECCACLELCKPRNAGNLPIASKTGTFPSIIPQLFRSLVTEPDNEKRWVSFTFPAEFDKYECLTGSISEWPEDEKLLVNTKTINEKVTLNCSVAFWSECMPQYQCEESCQSMGADRFRWFEDGCCECVGYSCPNFGVDENKCEKCSQSENLPLSIDELDYGEDDDSL